MLSFQQPILDVLAEMIAYDGTLKMGFTSPGAVDMAELMREMGEAGGVPGVSLD